MTDTAPLPTVDEVRASMRTALKEAMRSRDKLAVNALRSGLSAIDNAEAVPAEPTTFGDESPIAGATVGLGSTEAARRELTLEDVRTVLQAEIEERQRAAVEIEGAGHPDRAGDLRREAAVLESVVSA